MKRNSISNLTMIAVLFCLVFNSVNAKREQRSLEPKSYLDEKIEVLKDIIHGHSRLDVKIKALLGLERLEDVVDDVNVNVEDDLGSQDYQGLNAENFDDDAPTSWRDDSDLALVEYDPDVDTNDNNDNSKDDDDDDFDSDDHYGFLVQNDDDDDTATAGAETDFDILYDFDDKDFPEYDDDVMLYDDDDDHVDTQVDTSTSDDQDYDITDDVSVDYTQPNQGSSDDDTDDVVLLDDDDVDIDDDSYDGYNPLVLNDDSHHYHDHHHYDHHHDHDHDHDSGHFFDDSDDFVAPEPVTPLPQDNDDDDVDNYEDFDFGRNVLQL